MKEKYILKTITTVKEREIYKWEKAEKYKNSDYVLITQNNIPMELLIPIYFYEGYRNVYKHMKISLYKKQWYKEWENE